MPVINWNQQMATDLPINSFCLLVVLLLRFPSLNFLDFAFLLFWSSLSSLLTKTRFFSTLLTRLLATQPPLQPRQMFMPHVTGTCFASGCMLLSRPANSVWDNFSYLLVVICESKENASCFKEKHPISSCNAQSRAAIQSTEDRK